MKTLSRSNLAALVVAVGSLMAGASAVEAATITYDFEVSNFTGALSGQTFSGSFSFDDETTPFDNGFGLNLFELTAFDFDFDGSSFGLNELDLASSGAAFSNGTFVGLEAFETNDLFSIFDDGLGSVFAYADGFGEVNYTLQPPMASVPEPATAISLLVLGAIGTGTALRRKAA